MKSVLNEQLTLFPVIMNLSNMLIRDDPSPSFIGDAKMEFENGLRGLGYCSEDLEISKLSL